MATMRRSMDEKDIPTEMVRLATLLQHGRPPRPCRLTARHLESLAALCDASIHSTKVSGAAAATNNDVAQFYGTSTSMAKVLEHVSMESINVIDFLYLSCCSETHTTHYLPTWFQRFLLIMLNVLTLQGILRN